MGFSPSQGSGGGGSSTLAQTLTNGADANKVPITGLASETFATGTNLFATTGHIAGPIDTGFWIRAGDGVAGQPGREIFLEGGSADGAGGPGGGASIDIGGDTVAGTGASITISAGGAKVGGTNLQGGSVGITGGRCTGNQIGSISLSPGYGNPTSSTALGGTTQALTVQGNNQRIDNSTSGMIFSNPQFSDLGVAGGLSNIKHVYLSPIINYTGAGNSISFTSIQVDNRETSMPLGSNYFLRMRGGAAGTTDRFSVDSAGNLSWSGGTNSTVQANSTGFAWSSGTCGFTAGGSGTQYTFASGSQSVPAGGLGFGYTGTFVDGGSNGSAATNCFSITNTLNFTAASKTESVVGLLVKHVETSLPTGTQYLIRCMAGATGATDEFNVLNNGTVTVALAAGFNFSTNSGIKRASLASAASAESVAITNASTGYTYVAAQSLQLAQDGQVRWSNTNADPTSGNTILLLQRVGTNGSTQGVGFSDNGSNFAAIQRTIGFACTSTTMHGWTASSDPTAALDTAASRIAAASVAIGNGTQGDFSGTLKLTTLTVQGKIGTYSGTATTDWGVPAIVKSGRNAAVSAAAQTVIAASVIDASVDATVEVSANVLITTLGSGSFTVTCSYTDESNTARTLTLPFYVVAGTSTTTLNAAVPYMGDAVRIRCKANTNVSVQSTGTFTGCTYNIEASIKRIS